MIEPTLIEALVLRIDRDPYELSPNKRMHFMARAKLVKQWRTATYYALYQDSATSIRLEPPYTVQYLVTRKRSVDLDAISPGNYALKAVVDELVKQRVLVEDSAKYLSYLPSVLNVNGKVPPNVVITITGATAA